MLNLEEELEMEREAEYEKEQARGCAFCIFIIS